MNARIILRNRGLTWLEFLVIITVLAVIAAFLVPNFLRARSQGSGTACKSNLKNIGTALEMYSSDYNKLYPSTLAKIVPEYLKVMPTCPRREGILILRVTRYPEIFRLILSTAAAAITHPLDTRPITRSTTPSRVWSRHEQGNV